MTGLSLDVGEAGRVVRHVGENESFFVVVLAQDLVLTQVEAIADTEPATEHTQSLAVRTAHDIPCKRLQLQKKSSSRL
jgi:hypothetical protein